MIEFGKSLRAARETKGYTIGQLAEITRLAPATISELEAEDFSRIAAPIYGRGFVKLYCEAVGLEAKPLVDEFMSIFNGERETEIRERTVAPAAPAAEPAAEPPVAEPLAAEPPVAEPLADKPAPAPQPDLFCQDAGEAPAPASGQPLPDTLSRYAAPFRSDVRPTLPPSTWRLCLVGVAALAVLVLVVCGLRLVYHATTPQAESDEVRAEKPQAPAEKPQVPAAPAGAPVKRTAQKIPSLYVD